MKELIHKETQEILKLLRQKYGNQALDNFQLKKIGKKYIGGNFLGVYPYDKYPDGKDGFSIINTDNSKQPGTHWIGVYQKNGTLYIYDSFGRHTKSILKNFFKDHVAKGYKIVDCNLKKEQGEKQNDCGLRSITHLMMEKKYGISNM